MGLYESTVCREVRANGWIDAPPTFIRVNRIIDVAMFCEYHQQFCHDTKDCEEWIDERDQLIAQGKLVYHP